MKKVWTFIGLTGLLLGCSSYAINDPHWVLDPPAHNLRGHTAADDRPESDCDPIKKPNGKIEYPCTVHTLGNYQNLLLTINRLQAQLKACQQGR